MKGSNKTGGQPRLFFSRDVAGDGHRVVDLLGRIRAAAGRAEGHLRRVCQQQRRPITKSDLNILGGPALRELQLLAQELEMAIMGCPSTSHGPGLLFIFLTQVYAVPFTSGTPSGVGNNSIVINNSSVELGALLQKALGSQSGSDTGEGHPPIQVELPLPTLVEEDPEEWEDFAPPKKKPYYGGKDSNGDNDLSKLECPFAGDPFAGIAQEIEKQAQIKQACYVFSFLASANSMRLPFESPLFFVLSHRGSGTSF